MPKGKSAITANTCPSSPFRSSARSGQSRDDLLRVVGEEEEDDPRHAQRINRDGFGEDDRENHVRAHDARRVGVAAHRGERGTGDQADADAGADGAETDGNGGSELEKLRGHVSPPAQSCSPTLRGCSQNRPPGCSRRGPGAIRNRYKNASRRQLGDGDLLLLTGKHEGRVLLLLVHYLGDVLFLVILLAVARRAQRHEDQREEGEDERLDEADEDLEKVEGYGAHHR